MIIIGAGISGLNCATDLVALGYNVLCIEASDRVGGRMRTDTAHGFLLDRGFQILLTAYSEVQRKLDLESLKLHDFKPGAMVRIGGSWHTVSDPLRDPAHALASAVAPIGTFADKLKVAALKSEVTSKTDDELLFSTAATASEWLTEVGFSEQIKSRFFKPFFSGVFLETELTTSAGFLKFLYKMFSLGHGALPENGIGAIADQLAARLPATSLRLNSKVESVSENEVKLASGETLQAKKIVLACDAANTQKLFPAIGAIPHFHSCATLYFAAKEAPIKGPWLLLNGEQKGPINTVAVLTEVSKTYSESGEALISVTVVGDLSPELEANVLNQLKDWFGEDAGNWRHLRTYRIKTALPEIEPRSWKPAAPLPAWLEVIGDFTETPSLQGAMHSGALVATQIANSLSEPVKTLR